MPGIVSWPAIVKGPARQSWDPVITMDFLATILDVTGVQRPESQRSWGFDGVSLLPILRGDKSIAERGIGWMYSNPGPSVKTGYAFRYGKWKLAVGGVSCDPVHASFDCSKPQLYDMQLDPSEEHDLALREPVVLAAIQRNFTIWHASIERSIANETHCPGHPHPVPLPPTPPVPFSACNFSAGFSSLGVTFATGHVLSKEACCGACIGYSDW